MTKLKLRAGKPLCPKCGYPLYAMVTEYHSLATLRYVGSCENWQIWGGVKEEEEVAKIYCRTADCGFSLVGDAIHSVEVEEERHG